VERLEKAKEIKKNSTKVYGPLTEDIKIYVDKQIKQMRMKELAVTRKINMRKASMAAFKAEWTEALKQGKLKNFQKRKLEQRAKERYEKTQRQTLNRRTSFRCSNEGLSDGRLTLTDPAARNRPNMESL